MIVRLIENQEYKGASFQKGAEIAVTNREAKRLCEEGLAVADKPFPCEKRQKKAAVKKSNKIKKATEKDSEVLITNKL